MDYKFKDTSNSAQESGCPTLLCGSEEVQRNKTHLRALPDQPHRLRSQTIQKEGEGERMLKEPQARPKRDVKPPEWLKDYVT